LYDKKTTSFISEIHSTHYPSQGGEILKIPTTKYKKRLFPTLVLYILLLKKENRVTILPIRPPADKQWVECISEIKEVDFVSYFFRFYKPCLH